MAEEIERSPWTVVVSRDKRKAQVIDASGNSLFGGSWLLTPELAEHVVSTRMMFPLIVRSLLTSEDLSSTLMDTLLHMKPLFEEFRHWPELDYWAEKGLDLISAIHKADQEDP